jgi:hypothetical protein
MLGLSASFPRPVHLGAQNVTEVHQCDHTYLVTDGKVSEHIFCRLKKLIFPSVHNVNTLVCTTVRTEFTIVCTDCITVCTLATWNSKEPHCAQLANQ